MLNFHKREPSLAQRIESMTKSVQKRSEKERMVHGVDDRIGKRKSSITKLLQINKTKGVDKPRQKRRVKYCIRGVN